MAGHRPCPTFLVVIRTMCLVLCDRSAALSTLGLFALAACGYVTVGVLSAHFWPAYPLWRPSARL